jgi:hypothetical protein
MYVIRHGAYENPDDYLPYMIESEGLIMCRISNTKRVKIFNVFAREDVALKADELAFDEISGKLSISMSHTFDIPKPKTRKPKRT